MPAEWEPHEATWLAWPHEARRLAGQARAHPVGLRRGRAPPRARRARAHPRARRRDGPKKARARCSRAWASTSARVRVLPRADRPQLDARHVPAVRDATTPASVAMTNWRFNGWAKYANHKKDDAVNDTARASGSSMTQWKPTVDGRRASRGASCSRAAASTSTARGTMLTTEECLLSPVQARNPGMSREELERVLASTSACARCCGSATASRATTRTATSTISRASSTRRTVVIAAEDDAADANHAPLRENRARLEAMTNADGERAARRDAAHAGAASCSTACACPRATRTSTSRNARRARADLQRPARPRGARDPRATSSPRAPSSASTPSIWSGASARCTA